MAKTAMTDLSIVNLAGNLEDKRSVGIYVHTYFINILADKAPNIRNSLRK